MSFHTLFIEKAFETNSDIATRVLKFKQYIRDEVAPRLLENEKIALFSHSNLIVSFKFILGKINIALSHNEGVFVDEISMKYGKSKNNLLLASSSNFQFVKLKKALKSAE